MKSNSSGLIAHPIAPIQRPLAINPLPAKLGSNILDSKFNNNVLNTLVPNLVPDLNKLELLGREVQYQQDLQTGLEVSTIRQTPIFKRLASFIIRSTFSTLFPYGKANFNILQSRIVTLAAYAKYMLKYQDN